jgi:D-alanyl-D-alanine carboxypeptidase/D-alanyl-D-alanine-endopeptidase (penicillin-binding protein 4)
MVRIALLAAALCALLAPAAHAAGPARTKQILERAMAQAGSGSGAYVVDLDTGRALFDDDGSVARVPASVEKLYTSATALIRYGAEGTLSTNVHADAPPSAWCPATSTCAAAATRRSTPRPPASSPTR